MRIKLTLFIFITIIAFGFSCGKSDKTYTIKMKDGVNYVHNLAPAWGDEPKVELELVQRIGELDVDDENYLLFHPTDVVRDGDGNIYVVDQGNNRVQKYDKDGNYLLTIGREGQGPGDLLLGTYRNRVNIVLTKENELVICNRRNVRYDYFTTGGKYKKSLKRRSNLQTALHFRILQSGEFIAGTYSLHRSIKNKADLHLLTIFDSEETYSRGIGDFEISNYSSTFTTFNNAIGFELDKSDNIYLTHVFQNRIEKYTPWGELLFQSDRPLPYKIKELREFGDEVWVTAYDLNNQGLDNKGRFWVATRIKPTQKAKNEGEEDTPAVVVLDIFDKDGVMLGRIPRPKEGTIRIFDDRLYIVDASTEMCVYEYKIVEK